MIGTIDVAVNAANPQMPLSPVYAFTGSPSRFAVRNVPRRIGEWSITSVSVTVNYPDNTSDTVTAVLTGGVWVATVDGCDTPGTSINGFIVKADGTDENGDAVTGYILGCGDVQVITRESSITAGTVTYKGDKGDTGVPGENGTDGSDGVTPHVGDNGHWFIGTTDTGVVARGVNGTNGTDGEDGITPHIGENGHWFIGDEDTGVSARGPKGDSGSSSWADITNTPTTLAGYGITDAALASSVPTVVSPSSSAAEGAAASAKATWTALELKCDVFSSGIRGTATSGDSLRKYEFFIGCTGYFFRTTDSVSAKCWLTGSQSYYDDYLSLSVTSNGVLDININDEDITSVITINGNTVSHVDSYGTIDSIELVQSLDNRSMPFVSFASTSLTKNGESSLLSSVASSVGTAGSGLQTAVDARVDAKKPTKVSQLTNDSGFVTADAIPVQTRVRNDADTCRIDGEGNVYTVEKEAGGHWSVAFNNGSTSWTKTFTNCAYETNYSRYKWTSADNIVLSYRPSDGLIIYSDEGRGKIAPIGKNPMEDDCALGTIKFGYFTATFTPQSPIEITPPTDSLVKKSELTAIANKSSKIDADGNVYEATNSGNFWTMTDVSTGSSWRYLYDSYRTEFSDYKYVQEGGSIAMYYRPSDGGILNQQGSKQVATTTGVDPLSGASIATCETAAYRYEFTKLTTSAIPTTATATLAREYPIKSLTVTSGQTKALDSTINTITPTATTTIAPPTAKTIGARDWLVVVTQGSTVSQVKFSGSYVADSSFSLPTMEANKTYVFSFTEISSNKFIVSVKEVADVSLQS